MLCSCRLKSVQFYCIMICSYLFFSIPFHYNVLSIFFYSIMFIWLVYSIFTFSTVLCFISLPQQSCMYQGGTNISVGITRLTYRWPFRILEITIICYSHQFILFSAIPYCYVRTYSVLFIHSFIHSFTHLSFIPDISITYLQVHCYSEVLPTTAFILCRSSHA